MEIDELTVLQDAAMALSRLDDPQARTRVLGYLVSKFGGGNGTMSQAVRTFKASPGTHSPSVSGGEVPGIACLQEDGSFLLTVRDLKANSTINAAIRVTLISILAYEMLTGEKQVSSRRVVVPSLREYRVYDSNTRTALARHKGIIRKGDLLSLDAHSRLEADQYMREILDPDVQGSWSPRSTGRRKARSRQGSVDETPGGRGDGEE